MGNIAVHVSFSCKYDEAFQVTFYLSLQDQYFCRLSDSQGFIIPLPMILPLVSIVNASVA
jgi:hypothetical protein